MSWMDLVLRSVSLSKAFEGNFVSAEHIYFVQTDCPSNHGGR